MGTEFLRAANGTLSAIEKDGLALDGIAQGIIKKKTASTGDYFDPNDGIRKGYLARDGQYRSDVNLGLDVVQTSPRGMNKHGALAGFYIDTGGLRHGFILKGGALQTVDADETGTSALEAINKKELTSGQVVGPDGNPHSFLYDNATGTFTNIEIPDGSILQQAWGVNDKGAVAVSTDIATYIYCTRDVHCPDGGSAIADGRSWKMKPGASLLHNGNGRRSVKPPGISPRAARQ